MDLIDQLKALASKIEKQKDAIQTEEATKNAFIMPFIQLLGYNVFDPTEVTPELDADVGIKKGEKVDYAILKDGKPIILFECKSCKNNLENESMTQLMRYFHATKAKFGVLTNGILYKFFTDLDSPNTMDCKPFFELNLSDIKENLIEDLKKFSKTAFDAESIVSVAEELKYTKEIKKKIQDEINAPSEEFIKFLTSSVYSGRLTTTVKQQFSIFAKKAINQFFSDKISDSLKKAISSQEKEATEKEKELGSVEPKSSIVTTEEEKEAHIIIKAIARQITDCSKITMRDAQSYCSIIFDDNNRKPICRLYFNNLSKMSIGIFTPAKTEEKFPLSSLDDLYTYSEKFLDIIKCYLPKE